MGKKSLLKSTSKKKNAKAKSDSGQEAATKPVTAASKKPKAKATPKKATPETSKASSTKAKESAPKPAKALSVKELLLLKFDTVKPDNLFSVPSDETARQHISSPPFISGLDSAETERIRKLLFKTFDLSVPDSEPAQEAPPEPKAPVAEAVAPAPEPEAPPVPISELLKLKFDTQPPATLYVPPAAPKAAVESPPFVSGLDSAETERIRKLLFKTFDLSVPDSEPAIIETQASAAEETAPQSETVAPVSEPEAAEPVIEAIPIEAETAPEPAPEAISPEPEATLAASAPAPPETPHAEASAPPPEPEIYRPEPIASVSQNMAETEKPLFNAWKGLNPMIKKAIFAGMALAAVFILLILASYQNTTEYYLIAKDGALEVWQGKWAPMGKDRIAILPGMEIPEHAKSVYSRAEVGPLIVENHLNRANRLMTAPGTPDIEQIRNLLAQALPFAATDETRQNITLHLNRIDLTALLFKADIAAGDGTPEGLETAAGYLKEAADLATADAEKQLIQLKLEDIDAKLKPAQTVAKEPVRTPPTEESAVQAPAEENPAQTPPVAGKSE
ncbi:MAG: hypothetical protein RBT11_07670 [Desulfobacterales bacterium]|nr:hypothetical protein [Desulfobacterales bacterium]